jgi:hypothetical protein
MNKVLKVFSDETASVVALTVGGTIGGLVLWVLLIDAAFYLLS